MVKKEAGLSKNAAERGTGKGSRRLKGIINNVLRRRINDCEKDLRPSVLQFLDSSPPADGHDVYFPVEQRLMTPAGIDARDHRFSSTTWNVSALVSAPTPCEHRTVSDPGAYPNWGRLEWNGVQDWEASRCTSHPKEAGASQHGQTIKLSSDNSSFLGVQDSLKAYPALQSPALHGHYGDDLPSQAYGVRPITAFPVESWMPPSGAIKPTRCCAISSKSDFVLEASATPLHNVSHPQVEHECTGGLDYDYRWMDYYAREACAVVGSG